MSEAVPHPGDFLVPILFGRGISIEPLVELTVLGAPVPKGRPRFSVYKGRIKARTPEETRAAEKAVACLWKFAARGQKFDGPLSLGCVFFVPDHQYLDGDNFMKLVMDAGTQAGVWFNDAQIVTHVGHIEVDAQRPRTEAMLCRSETTLWRWRARRPRSKR